MRDIVKLALFFGAIFAATIGLAIASSHCDWSTYAAR
jgi:hypothetical protein